MPKKKTSPVDECVAVFGQPDLSYTYEDISKFLDCTRKKELIEIVVADPEGAADTISQLQSDHAMLYLRATMVLNLASKVANEAEPSPRVEELKKQIETMQSGLTDEGRRIARANNMARAAASRESIRKYFKGMKGKSPGKSLEGLIEEVRNNKPEVLLKKPDNYKDKTCEDIKKLPDSAFYGKKYLEKNILKNLFE